MSELSQTTELDQHLLELATPALYRRNAFRVLDLPLHTNSRDVRQLLNRRRMEAKFGISSSRQKSGPLSLHPAPSEEEIHTAVDRLNRPVDRLLDELFWFWPVNGNPAGDPALSVLRKDVEQARRLWMEQAGSEDRRVIAIHNLAVLNHLTALDRETGSDGDGQPRRHSDDCWLTAFKHWKEAVDDETFWRIIRDRVRELNDLQLTTGFVRRVRETLPTALLLISARIAVTAAGRSDTDSAVMHTRLVHQVEFGEGLADFAIREALKPVSARIKTTLEIAKSRWKATPQHGDRFVRDLHAQVGEALAIVDAVLPADDITRISLHDSVAESMLEGQVAFGKKTNDWTESLRLLDLADGLAVSEALKARLKENIEIVKENHSGGNNYYSPGYWDLPEETIAQLEEAQSKTQSGDHEAALRILVAMDLQVGPPLRRSLAFCLSQRGGRIAIDAFDEFNRTPPKRLEKFLEVIQRRGTLAAPNPSMSTWQLPPCPCCPSPRPYTSWVNGEYKGQRYWMCAACSAEDDREREGRKATLRTKLRESLEFAVLAAEIDGDDPGIVDHLKWMKKVAKDYSLSIPKTADLRRRLATGQPRRVRHSFEERPIDRLCHFCGENAADESCRITVPLCSEPRKVQQFFGEGSEFLHADVVVPRCRRCRDEHRELPRRIEKWQAARQTAGADERFPDLSAAEVKAGSAAKAALEVVAEKRKAVAQAESAIAEAEAIGSRCDHCHSDGGWENGLCRNCDRSLFRLGAFSWSAVLGVLSGVPLAVLSLGRYLSGLSGSTGPSLLPHGLVVLVAFALGGLASLTLALKLKREQKVRREDLRVQRQEEFQARRANALQQAHTALCRAVAHLNSAEQDAEKPTRSWEKARQALATAKANAISDFDALYPKPKHPTGIQRESAYPLFDRIDDLRRRGWSFGSDLAGGGASPSNPVNVRGLVSRQPEPPSGTDKPGRTAPGSALEQHQFEGIKCVRCGRSRTAVEAFGWGCKQA